ncbi:MAG: HD domain-containing phosphohydrolase [bacterium]
MTNDNYSIYHEQLVGSENEEKLLMTLFALYKNARILEKNNPHYERNLIQLVDLINQVCEEEYETIIKIINNHFFINKKFVRFDGSALIQAEHVLSEWEKMNIGGIMFTRDVNTHHLNMFLHFLISPDAQLSDPETLAKHIEKITEGNIVLLLTDDIEEEKDQTTEEQRRELRKTAKGLFFKAISTVEDIIVKSAQGRDLNISQTKRVVHSLVDHLEQDMSSLLELTALNDFDDYTCAHSTNVCIYSLTQGVRLGMDRARLSQLGFSALFHDIGKIKLSHDLICKPEAFDVNDWKQMQQHPLMGAKTILRNFKIDDHTARAACAAFEHHINIDYTGYPRLSKRQPLNLFSKIITISDVFDALTSGRVYIKKKISPDQVLKKMRLDMRNKFDPFLLKLFHSIIGIYPAGTLVLLSTDEIAIVLANNDEMDRPMVNLIGNRNGLLDEPVWVDLSKPENYHRTIIRLVEPEKYGLNLRDFILKD